MIEKPLPHLTTFSRAAELGSFTAAARELGMTQAAVSQRIQQLETTLKTGLFRRCAGRVTLTEAGHKLHDFARRIIDLHVEARTVITGVPSAVSGELVLAASSIPGDHLLPPALAAFRRVHPQITVRVSVTDSDDVLRLVEHGDAHLGLVGNKSESPNLEFSRFACDELVLIAPAHHKWSRRRRVLVRELIGQPLIQREQGSGSRRCLERALQRVGQDVSCFKVTLDLGSNEAIKEAVQQGLGLAVLSRRSVQKEVNAGTLLTLPVVGLTLDRDLFVVCDRRGALPLPARLFRKQLHLAPDPIGP